MRGKTAAIVLAGGSGTRMGTKVPKQYLVYKGHPLVYYPLAAFTKAGVDAIILVVDEGHWDYAKETFGRDPSLTLPLTIVKGGSERCLSVYQGLLAAGDFDYVLIHDGARMAISPDLIQRMMDEVKEKKACIAAVPVKDTIKVVDPSGRITATPPRAGLYSAQTPQAFDYKAIKEAFDRMLKEVPVEELSGMTDDSLVMERFGSCPVYVVYGDYANIKITTKEDLEMINDR